MLRRSSLEPERRRLSLQGSSGSHRTCDAFLDPAHAAILFRDSRGYLNERKIRVKKTFLFVVECLVCLLLASVCGVKRAAQQSVQTCWRLAPEAMYVWLAVIHWRVWLLDDAPRAPARQLARLGSSQSVQSRVNPCQSRRTPRCRSLVFTSSHSSDK
ncbi:hypothetical protein B566_EDAN016906 [Ephemera danica]|nr:hypothetical protein B566_EDAN016906 [Ephemera danica]